MNSSNNNDSSSSNSNMNNSLSPTLVTHSDASMGSGRASPDNSYMGRGIWNPSYVNQGSQRSPQQQHQNHHQQQQQQQQQQQPQENYQTAGSNNPWAGSHSQQLQPADALKPMPTGSNNPFAQRTQTQFNNHAKTGPPTLNSLSEDRATNQFAQNNSQYGQSSLFAQPSQPNPIAGFQAPQPPKSTSPLNPHHARLNALLGSGEGQDTFGNVGDLRIPAQHTTPGTFVNSAGLGLDRLHAAPTGNPFFGQQFTGMPQQTGFQQQPANNNPWAGQQQQQRGGGSLIDL